jgi:hypothetical protein
MTWCFKTLIYFERTVTIRKNISEMQHLFLPCHKSKQRIRWDNWYFIHCLLNTIWSSVCTRNKTFRNKTWAENGMDTRLIEKPTVVGVVGDGDGGRGRLGGSGGVWLSERGERVSRANSPANKPICVCRHHHKPTPGNQWWELEREKTPRHCSFGCRTQLLKQFSQSNLFCILLVRY